MIKYLIVIIGWLNNVILVGCYNSKGNSDSFAIFLKIY